MSSRSPLVDYPKIAHTLFGLMSHPMTLAQSKVLIRNRLERRDEMFLEMVRSRIFAHPQSPYLPLLALAGCEFGDIETMVRQQGLERTLDALRRAGVYLSFDEFKGRADVVRGGRTFRFSEDEFDNPARGPTMEIQTGATRSGGSRVPLSFDFLADQRVPSYHVMLEALGAADGPVLIWHTGFPSGAGISMWLPLAKMRRPPLRWYSMTDPAGPTVAKRHRVMLRMAQLMGYVLGMRLPLPEFTPVTEAERVAEDIGAVLRRHGRCALITTPSAAVRLAAAARAQRQSLEGLAIIVGGEPLTEGKHAEIRASGARVGPQYVFSEAGAVGGLCGAPDAVDEVHLLADCFAMILHRREWPLVGTADAFMFTSLLPSAPKILLNVESDDFGNVTERRCGCVWDDLGMHTHLSAIRSFSKLTGEAMTLLGTDCVRVIEEVLPREFGGRSIDYQLLEAEDADRLTRLYLVVSPSVGPVDEARILARFGEEIRRASNSPLPDPAVLPLWRQADTIKVVRREPVLTARGKLLPFHTQAVASVRAAAQGALVPGSR